MAVKFSLNLQNIFKAKAKVETNLPDNGFELPGTNGEAIILIHGMTGTPHEMRFLANYLNRQGYAIYCPRLANHGAPLHILQMSKWQMNSKKELQVSAVFPQRYFTMDGTRHGIVFYFR